MKMKNSLLSLAAVAVLVAGYAMAAQKAQLNLTLPKGMPAPVSTASAQGGVLNLTIHYPNGKTVTVTRHWNSFVFDGIAPQTVSVDYTTDTVFCGCFDQ